MFLRGVRRRPSGLPQRSLEEDADSDRGRVLFCAPFRRLQNKAQVFSLEPNAAIRSRLTHSLEVSSIGRFVAQQALGAFGADHADSLGLAGNERSMLTFVETACLLHDIGNPPFGHFAEIAISDWFNRNENILKPDGVEGRARRLWDEHFSDFCHFDGNPQGFRIATRLQASQTGDLHGLNLTATTLAATLKYPWSSAKVGTVVSGQRAKKNGFFLTELDVMEWVRENLQLAEYARHPLAYLMEAADDIAYCISDIEDGIEKHLIDPADFADYISGAIQPSGSSPATPNPTDLGDSIELLKNRRFREDDREVDRLTPMQDFRSAAIRILAHSAGTRFAESQAEILKGSAPPLLHHESESRLLEALKAFARSNLYCSAVVRDRELTAYAVLAGLLTAYANVMGCERERFMAIRSGSQTDQMDRRIAREASLAGRIGQKVSAVYDEAVRLSDKTFAEDEACRRVMERVFRIHMIVDFVTGMTDEFALTTFQLVTGSALR